ncbi:hypothetical protein [Streptomyces sp. B29(2018)]|uniref:hypothetical protein n=1 Tax=Streptomyces sp. B29(2018) TaxID=2485016 RepID=UPI001F0CC03D|nr:hypothetical protein [Streptomyces sp. B29(2018)]
MGGEHPPPSDLQPLPGEQQQWGDVVGPAALERYEMGGVGLAGAVPSEVPAVYLAQGDSDGDDG